MRLPSTVEVEVNIPEKTKSWLVDDCWWLVNDLITQQKHLFYFPAKNNVNSILEDYVNCKKSTVKEAVTGIKEYLKVVLRTQLLYAFQRPQYVEIWAKHQDDPKPQVYGTWHLLRLFVRLGVMLAYILLDERAILSYWLTSMVF